MRKDTRIYKLRNGAMISLQKNFQYVVYYPQKDGILVKKTNQPPQKGFVFSREASANCVVLPTRLRIAYGIDNEVCIRTIDQETSFIEVDLRASKLPQPLNGLGFKKAKHLKLHSKPDGVITHNREHRLYISDMLPKEWLNRKISVYADDCLRIEIEEAGKSACNNYPTLKDIRDEYGSRLQHYGGKQLTFIQNTSSKNEYTNITIPKFFRIQSGLKKGDKLNWWKTERNGKTVYIFSQVSKTCEFSKEEILPAKEKPEKVVLCEECAQETDEIGLIMVEIKELKELIHKLVEINQSVTSENKQLRNKFKEIGGILNG